MTLWGRPVYPEVSMGYDTPILVGSAIIILPIVVGWVFARSRAARIPILIFGLVALALTALGVFYFINGEALGTSDSGMQGLGVVLAGFLCTLVGLMFGFAASGCALAHAQHSGRWRWFIALLIFGVLPLLATVGFFDLLFLVIMPGDPGDPATTVPLSITFWIAPIGCIAPFIYSVVALRRPREQLAARRLLPPSM
jgi:hypothetical protein